MNAVECPFETWRAVIDGLRAQGLQYMLEHAAQWGDASQLDGRGSVAYSAAANQLIDPVASPVRFC